MASCPIPNGTEGLGYVLVNVTGGGNHTLRVTADGGGVLVSNLVTFAVRATFSR